MCWERLKYKMADEGFPSHRWRPHPVHAVLERQVVEVANELALRGHCRVTAGQKLHIGGQHFMLRARLPVLTRPTAPAQPAFKKDRTALAQVFRRGLGQTPKRRTIDVADFLFPLGTLAVPVVGCEAQRGHGGAIGGIAQLGIARQMTSERQMI